MANRKGSRDSVATRIKKQAGHLRRNGLSLEQPDEMLDLYLLGESAADIAVAYKTTAHTVHRTVAHQALLRLMIAHQVERIEELDGMEAKR